VPSREEADDREKGIDDLLSEIREIEDTMWVQYP
jgi:hypothetical protein